MPNQQSPKAPDPGRTYRLTKYSIPWVLGIFLLVPYEIVMVALGYEGGPLTHVVRWALGTPQGIRWWLVGGPLCGFLLWLPPHWMHEPVGFRALCIFVAVGLVAGIIGLLVTRLT